MQEDEAFRPIEATFVSSGRTANVQAEPVAEADDMADIAIELRDELARLGHMIISTSELVGTLGDPRVRSPG